MKNILKIIGLAFLIVGVIVGSSFAIGYFRGDFGEKNISIDTLSFSENSFLVVEDFDINLNYSPLEATELNATLKVEVGKDLVTVPTNVKANEPITIKLNKDAKGNNKGGYVEISAKSGNMAADQRLRFWIDVAIPNVGLDDTTNGLLIATNAPHDTLTSGGAAFNVYVYTNPSLALYADTRGSQENQTGVIRNDAIDLLKSYKNIKLTSDNSSSIEILNNGVGVESFGYYDPNYKTRGANSPFSEDDRPTSHHTVSMRYLKFTVQPKLSSDADITLTAKSLRTYFMQRDFVNVNDAKYEGDLISAFRDFSLYIEKYKHYISGNEELSIVGDSRSFTRGAITYENGADFIESITREVQGQTRVNISANSETEYLAALYYLYVERDVSFNVENIKISALNTTNQIIQYNLFEFNSLTRNQLIEKFGIVLTPQDSNFPPSTLVSKVASVKILALKGVDADSNGNLDTLSVFDSDQDGVLNEQELYNLEQSGYIVVDNDGNGIFEGNELNQLLMVSASEEILIKNPHEVEFADPANPRWEIQSLNPQTSINNGLRLRFYIEEEGVYFYDDVLLTVKENLVESLILHDINDMVINENLNSSQSESKSYTLDSSSYTLVGTNPSYSLVKYFITKDSLITEQGFNTVRLSNDFTFELLKMTEVGSTNVHEAYEITYSSDGGLTKILEAINVSNRGPVQIFAAVVKTDYTGITPILDEDGNYIIVKRSDNKSFSISAYIDNLNFYTVNEETGVYTKRNVPDEGQETSSVILLSNNTYSFYITNLELNETGLFDESNAKYVNKQNIDYYTNLTYALRRYAYGEDNNRANFIQFTYSTVNDRDMLQIERGDGWETYSYDSETNIITVSVSVVSVDSLTTTYLGNEPLPEFRFNLAAEYKNINPVDLSISSSISIHVKFASVDSDVKILNTSEVTSGVIEVQATATEGMVQWLYKENNQLIDIFNITGVEYNFDIALRNALGLRKLDPSFDNEAFITAYLEKLQGFTAIKWSVVGNKTDFVKLYYDELGVPQFEIIKGTPQGELVTIQVTIETYPNGNSVYLQRRTAQITLKLIQEHPVPMLYSVNTLDSIGEHLIANDGSYPFIIEGGSSFNLLQKVGDSEAEEPGLPVYSYTHSTENNPQNLGKFAQYLIDVRFESSLAPITGGLEFEIENISQTQPAIYFLNSLQQKVYSTFAIKDPITSDFSLELHSENITNEKLENLLIKTPFGDVYNFNIKVTSNINVTKPVGQNITTKDNVSTNLNDQIKAEQTLLISDVRTTLRLPISFELDETSAYFAELTEGTGSLFNIGYLNDDNSIIDRFAYVRNSADNNLVEVKHMASVLTPYQVSEIKNLVIKLFYYVPLIDTNGNFIFVSNTGAMLHLNSEGDYVLHELGEDEEIIEIPYNGNRYFLFEKREYENNSTLENIIITPSVEVVKGEELTEPIVVASGQSHNLYNTKINSQTNPTSTNFVDIKRVLDQSLILPDDVEFDEDGYFNYLSVYKKYFRITFDTTSLNSQQLALYSLLNPSISNGLIQSNSINTDLTLYLRITKLEGEVATLADEPEFTAGIPKRQGASFNIQIKFLNSVKFNITDKTVEQGSVYDKTLDTQTNQVKGHTYTDINKVKSVSGVNTLVVQAKSIELYNVNNADLNNNVVNIVGGSGEDLLKNNLTAINVYYFNGTNYVLYNETNRAININWNKTTGANPTTNLISLELYNAVNQDIKFKVELVSENFNLIGNYFFTLKSDVKLITNYPVYSGYEVVTKNSVVNLHSNYINVDDRIQIKYNDNIYKLTTTDNIIYLVNIGNSTDKIKVVNEVGTSFDINYFTYILLDANKNAIGTTPELTGVFPRYSNTYNNGTLTFTNNITVTKNIYVRVMLFNGSYIDYRFNVQPEVVFEKVSLNNEGAEIKQSSPLIVNANESFNIYDYIEISDGSLGDLIVKYNDVSNVNGFVYKDDEYKDISIYTKIALNETVKLDHVVQEQIVSFSIYGSKFVDSNTSTGRDPIILYVKVLPNFTVENHLTNIPAGTLINLVNKNGEVQVDENMRGMFNLGGESTNNVNFEISKINGVTVQFNYQEVGENLGNYSYVNSKYVYVGQGNGSFIKVNEENSYGIKISKNETLISNDISSSVNLEFEISKLFNENKVIKITKTITLSPNAIFSFLKSYNTTQGFQQETATAIGDTNKQFVLNDTDGNEINDSKIEVINYYGQQIVTTAGVVQVRYALFNPATQQEYSSMAGVVANFSTTTGNFEILSVNETQWVHIKMEVTWFKNAVNNETYSESVKYYQVYNIRIDANVHSVTVTYSDTQNNALLVYAGSTIELDFANPNTIFAQQNNRTIRVNALQKNISNTDVRVNLVLMESDNNYYTLYADTSSSTTKYFITFKQFSGDITQVNIRIYLDLTGVVTGVVKSGIYYDSSINLRFHLQSSLNNFSYKEQYLSYSNPATPLNTNYNQPTFKYVGENKGSYELVIVNEVEKIYYVGKNQGDYDFTLNDKKYTFVGEGLGSYIIDDVYEYVGEGLGNYKIDQENSEFEEIDEGLGDYIYEDDLYVYVGQGLGNYILTYGEYTFDEGNGQFVLYSDVYIHVGQGNGYYNLLQPNQYDLFDMFNVNLKSGLSFEKDGNIYINKVIIRNSLVYRVLTGTTSVLITKEGIATFMPSTSPVTVTIEVSLYNFNTPANIKTLHVIVNSTGQIEIKSIDGAVNSISNRFEVNKFVFVGTNEGAVYKPLTFTNVGANNGDYNFVNDVYEYVGQGLGAHTPATFEKVEDGTGTHKLSFNLNEVVIYGYRLLNYLDLEIEPETSEEVNGLVTIVNRQTQDQGITVTQVRAYLTLNNDNIGYIISNGGEYATVNNSMLIVNNFVNETINITVTVTIAGVTNYIYLIVNNM